MLSRWLLQQRPVYLPRYQSLPFRSFSTGNEDETPNPDDWEARTLAARKRAQAQPKWGSKNPKIRAASPQTLRPPQVESTFQFTLRDEEGKNPKAQKPKAKKRDKLREDSDILDEMSGLNSPKLNVPLTQIVKNEFESYQTKSTFVPIGGEDGEGSDPGDRERMKEDFLDRSTRELQEAAARLENADESTIEMEAKRILALLERTDSRKRKRKTEKQRALEAQLEKELKRKQEIFAKEFMVTGDESKLDKRTNKLLQSAPNPFSISKDTRIRPEDVSPRGRKLMEIRFIEERKLTLQLNEFIQRRQLLGDEVDPSLPFEQKFAAHSAELWLVHDVRVARMRTDTDFLVIGFLTRIEDAHYKRLRIDAAKDKKLEKLRTKIQEKYGEKNAKRREKRIATRKAKQHDIQTNFDWFWYDEIKYWIHRRHLESVQVRGTIALLLNNPSYTNSQKRQALDYMTKTMDEAQAKPREWYDEKWQYYKNIAKENPNRTSPDLTIDPDFKVPKTYEELIEAAEAEMPYEERIRKFAPSKYPPRTHFLEY